MKKSEFRQLIKEVISEIDSDNRLTSTPVSLGDAIQRIAQNEAKIYIESGNRKRLQLRYTPLEVLELIYGKEHSGNEIKKELEIVWRLEVHKLFKNRSRGI